MDVRRQLRALGLAVAASLAIACGATPTPASTSPPPAASPVQASPNPNLVEFGIHLAEATSQEGQFVRSLAAATGSNDQLGLVARQMGEWAADEQAWLEEHPADACYEDAWLTFAGGVDDVATAAAAFGDLAAAPSPPTDSVGRAAAEPLQSGGESIRAAADLARRARAGCR